MVDDLYFDGDPELDSRRRHMERVLKGGPPRRKWPWVLAVLAGGSTWAIWNAGRRAEQRATDAKPSTESERSKDRK